MKSPGLIGSGSFGNVVTQRNAYGYFQRQRVKPTNPNTPAQVAVRSQQREATRAWAGLTAANRAAWIGFAAAHPVITPKGESQTLTGHAAFVSCYRLLATAGMDIDNASIPPAVKPGRAFDSAGVSVIVVTQTGPDTTTVIATLAPGTSNPGKVLVRASSPLGLGQTKNRGGFRQIAAADPNAGGPLVLTTAYRSVWGDLPSDPAYHVLFELVEIVDGFRTHVQLMDVKCVTGS